MNTKAIGFTSGKYCHQYLLFLFGIDSKGLLLCGGTVKIIDNKILHLIRIFADDGTDLSQVQAFNGAVHNSTF